MRSDATRRTSSSTVMSYESKSTLRRCACNCDRCFAASSTGILQRYLSGRLGGTLRLGHLRRSDLQARFVRSSTRRRGSNDRGAATGASGRWTLPNYAVQDQGARATRVRGAARAGLCLFEARPARPRMSGHRRARVTCQMVDGLVSDACDAAHVSWQSLATTTTAIGSQL
jgi:hypothetical protein